MGSRKWYDYAFFNTITNTEKEKVFEKFAVPESYKVSRQLVLNSYSNIDFKKAHEPILFIGGESDHIFPPDLQLSHKSPKISICPSRLKN